MRKSRILAVLMSVLMMISMLPAAVFAEAPAGALEGELKIKGKAAQDTTLSADYKKVKPEGITDDYVSFLWQRKDSGDGSLVDLGKEKTYKVTSADVGYKIVLTITGLEDKGVTGTLKATSAVVAEADTKEETPVEEKSQEVIPEEQTEVYEELPAEEESQEVIPEEQTEVYEELPAEEESQEVIPEEQTEVYEEFPAEEESQEVIPEEQSEVYEEFPQEDSEEVLPDAQVQEEVYNTEGEELTPVEEPGTEEIYYGDEELTPVDAEDMEENHQDEFTSFDAVAVTEDGSGVLDFGTLEAGSESDVEPQYITVKNTGTETLNFDEISPEHFMVQDIQEPLEAGEEVTLWIQPREGIEIGNHTDTITYTGSETAAASFEAKVNVVENVSDEQAEEDPAGNEEIPEDADQTEIADNENPANPDDTTVVDPEENPDDSDPADTDEPSADDPADIEEPSDVDEPSDDEPAIEEPSDTEGPEQPEEPEDPEEPQEPEDPEEPQEPDIDVTVSTNSIDFGKKTEGYKEAPEAQTVTIENNGSDDVKLLQPESEMDYFDVGALSSEVIASGEKAEFTIQPKTGLSVGTYQDVISIYSATDEEEPLETIDVSFVVKKKTVHKLTLNPETLDFGSVTSGYKDLPKAQTVTVTNDGNVTENLEQPMDSETFTIGALSTVELKPGASCTFTVQPVTGLKAGEYQEDIEIPTESETEAVVTAVITVNKKQEDKSVKLTAVQKPSEINGLENGTEKKAEALKLPATVVIETTKGNMKANVAWDVKGCAYDPKGTNAQTFTVKGTVTLPDGVKNPDKVSLVTSVKVSVNGYTANVASADNNQITGITPNGQYTTKSTISFTAVGAGMDNENPRKGDVRYLPLNWTVVNTNTWTSAPYAASFGMGRSGKYTLSVVFNRQEYDGSNWVNTGNQDTKKVSFSVVQAAEQTVTPTPGANQKKAVQTGDDTPIIPLVIVLIIAIACIAGVLVYRKKK